MHSTKTSTDLHWDDRANTEADKRKVNIADLAQRSIENDFIVPRLRPTDEILEVGCGNGYLTSELRQHTKFVDAFDYSDSMIRTAKEIYGETNNRFFVKSLLDTSKIDKQYDKAVCVRVLINLADLAEQQAAVANMAGWVRTGGELILIEGYRDGFDALSKLREKAAMPPLVPASINYYSHVSDLMTEINKHFTVIDQWNSGMFDLLTRVAYPLLAGPESAAGPSDFHTKVLPLARAVTMPELATFARLRGFQLRKN